MLTGLQGAEHRVVRKDGRHRIEATGQRFAEQRHVSLNAIVLLGEQFAGAAEPGLDLVQNKHHVMRGAELAYLCEIA